MKDVSVFLFYSIPPLMAHCAVIRTFSASLDRRGSSSRNVMNQFMCNLREIYSYTAFPLYTAQLWVKRDLYWDKGKIENSERMRGRETGMYNGGRM